MTEHHTSGGVPLDEDRIAALADEAERGFDPARLRRRPGRPPIGREAARVFNVRLEPELRAALDDRATTEGVPASTLVRAALRSYLGHPADVEGSDAREPTPHAAVRPTTKAPPHH